MERVRSDTFGSNWSVAVGWNKTAITGAQFTKKHDQVTTLYIIYQRRLHALNNHVFYVLPVTLIAEL